jgi:chromate transporter
VEKKKLGKVSLELFSLFFKIGLFTFGGGYAMIPLIEKEIVQNKRWIEKEEIVDVFAVAQSIPGAIAINSATFIGYKINGKKGALAATLGVILPSVLIILAIATVFSRFQENKHIQSAFKGIRSAVVALVAYAAIKIGKVSIKDRYAAIIFAGAFIAITFFNIHAIYAIIAGALIGMYLHKKLWV